MNKANWNNASMLQFDSVEGKGFIFPSWLTHGVEINESKEKGEKGWRVSVSFNFIQTDKEGRVG